MSRAVKRFEAVLEEQLLNPELRAQWERTAMARAVAITVVRYRAERSLSQKQLAERLGWKQSQVARLELGEHSPAIDTLIHLSRALDLEFLLDIRPSHEHGPTWVTAEVENAGVVERLTTKAGAHILVAAG
jgi:transcriptional regulator with XRE-family HTH domain